MARTGQGPTSMASAARRKARDDCAVVQFVARILCEIVVLRGQEWNSTWELCEGFDGVETTGSWLLREERLPSSHAEIDTVYVNPSRLRGCHDESESFIFRLVFATRWWANLESLAPGKTHTSGTFDDEEDQHLWRPEKLGKVLDQSRMYTWTLDESRQRLSSLRPSLSHDRKNNYCHCQTPPNPAHGAVTSGSCVLMNTCASWNRSSSQQNLSTGVYVERKRHECRQKLRDCRCGGTRHLFGLVKQLRKLRSKHCPGILAFRGVKEPFAEPGTYAFVYELPNNVSAMGQGSMVSLSDVMAGTEHVPRTRRLELARRICRTVADLHGRGVLHRNINKSSVVFCCCCQNGEDGATMSCPTPYLVGFEFARTTTHQTSYTFARDVEGDVSRHPDQQGVPRESFDEEHDVYALGVLVLEIGLWSSAVDVVTAHNNGRPPAPSTPEVQVRQHLLMAAQDTLPGIMGLTYADAAAMCLRGGGATQRRRDIAMEKLMTHILQLLEAVRVEL